MAMKMVLLARGPVLETVEAVHETLGPQTV